MSLLEQELLDQGAAIGKRAPSGGAAACAAAELIARPDVDYLLLAARGSSDNAARFALYAFSDEVRMAVALAAPSLYSDPESSPDIRGAAVLGISQSGQSPDIVGVLAAARAQGRPTIALTNDEASPLAAVANVVVPLDTGPERSVAATKTYLSSLRAIEQIIDRLSPDDERARWLDRLPELVDDGIRYQFERRAQFDILGGVSVLTVVGRGLDFSTAHETALKVRELAGMVTEPYSPADLLHGPVAAVGPAGGLWVVDSDDEPDDTLAVLLTRLQGRDLPTVIVSHRTPQSVPGALHVPVPAAAPRWVRAILAVLPGQVAAFQLATRRHVDLDHPHGLTKVTLTR